ncbi:MAG: hypothetical protein HKL80_07305 [Acidimicrobiales bacterium]|nr:hypothetical protein [Acidimicrobiales bacterium]
MRVFEDKVKALNLPLGEAIRIMMAAKSGVVANDKKTLIIEPEYNEAQIAILKILNLDT